MSNSAPKVYLDYTQEALDRAYDQRNWASNADEIIRAYGSCSFSSKVGQLAGNHFLTIVEGKHQLPELGRKVLWEGAQDVSFEAV